jgi:hypothetical protein
MQFIRKHLLEIIFSLAGGIGGLLYWKFIGCQTGTCPIKSVWYMSTMYGLVLGYLAGGIIDEIVAKIKGRA